MTRAKSPSALQPCFGDYADIGALMGKSERFARQLMGRPGAPRRISISPAVALFDLDEVRAWIRSLPRELARPQEPPQLVVRRYRSGKCVSEVPAGAGQREPGDATKEPLPGVSPPRGMRKMRSKVPRLIGAF